MPAVKFDKLTTRPGSDLRQLQIQHNALVRDAQTDALAQSTDVLWSWQSAAANSIQAIGRGSTDTNVATGKFIAAFAGIPEAKAAVAAGTAIGAQTVPADQWAVYAIDDVTGGTISFAPGAANATTGYPTEAAAIAATPARITAKARLGILTLKTKTATAWVAATDALAGGATGNPASITNYYPNDGLQAPTGTAIGPNGAVTAASHPAWSGGRNGVIIPTVLAIGSTDTRVGTTAFVYSANGVTNINKAAVAAGTAFGALGTIPADQWGIIVFLIDAVGTVTYLSGPSNYTSGYNSEAAAIGDLNKIFPSNTATVQLCMFGYVTIKTKAATAFVVGTDSPKGGATGNVASATNYYPTPGVALLQGESAALLGTREGVVLTQAQY